MPTSSGPIKQALVQAMRGNAPLKAAITGIHEGFAPAKAAYPFLTYHMAYSPYDYLWGSAMLRAGFDIFVWAENSVDANNIDALVVTALHDASLSVTGQTSLICRRVSDLSFADMDDEGKKVYQVGGTYEIWTDQPL